MFKLTKIGGPIFANVFEINVSAAKSRTIAVWTVHAYLRNSFYFNLKKT